MRCSTSAMPALSMRVLYSRRPADVYNADVRPWRSLRSRVLLKTPIFGVRAEDYRSRDTGHRHTFYFLDAPDWINVIPIDERGRVVMIRQHRYGSRLLELEIPGGAVNPGERDPLNAAKRELLEETGYEARRWVRLGFAHPNPAFHRNLCHMFLAVGARRVKAQELDHAEEIDVTLQPLSRISKLLGSGKIAHALVIAAFHRLHVRRARYQRLLPKNAFRGW
jgi:8-oxo-dGTP pyrophosphatase MutT (NUDIX family)